MSTTRSPRARRKRPRDDRLPAVSEKAFQGQVIALARLCGWRVAHFRAARTAQGWRTPVAADGAGWPDLVLVHPRRGLLLYRELKTDRGQVAEEQGAWLAALQAAGQDAAVWRPRDWNTIARTLKGEE